MYSNIKNLRDIREQRFTETYREQRTDVPSNTDHKIDALHEIVNEQLAPRIQQKSFNAATVDRRYFYYFQKRFTGRRCSCFIYETSPDAGCRICYSTGVVNGYEKFGTRSESVDFTTPDLIMVNVEPNLQDNTRPVYLRLKSGYNTGYVEARFNLKNNINEIDTYLIHQPIFNRGVKVRIFDPQGNDRYVNGPLDFKDFLNKEYIRVRLEYTLFDANPIVSHFYFRYKLQKLIQIYGDIAKGEEALQQSQIGTFDMYQEIPIFFDGRTVTNFQNEDILIRLSDNRRFKVVGMTKNVVANTLTSIDVRARFLISSIDTGSMSILP